MLQNNRNREPVFVFAQINARVGPLDRGEFYEDPLQTALEENRFGEVTGGGTLQHESGEIEYCGVDIDLTDLDNGIPFLCKFLTDLGAPKGSQLTYTIEDKDFAIPFGTREGLAIYLNGTDLPADVYANSDIDFVVDECNRLLGNAGSMQGHWQGPRETALYFFGPSASEIRQRLDPFLSSYPLCQRARVVQIA